MLFSSKAKRPSHSEMKSPSQDTSLQFSNYCPIGVPIAHFEDDYDVSEDPSHRAVEAIPYKRSVIQELIFWILSLASLGVFPLVLHWIPLAIHRWRFMKTSDIFQASRVVVVESTRKKQVVRCHRTSVRVSALQRALPSFACQRCGTQVSTNENEDKNYKTKMNAYRQGQSHLSENKEVLLTSGPAFTAGPNDVLETVTFEYRCLKYILNLWSGKFEPLSFDLGVSSDRLYDIYAMGLPLETAPEGVALKELLMERQALYGPACVNVPILPLYRVVASEIFHPLYIFQVAAIALWLKDEYYQYAAAIIVITLVMLIVEIFEVRHSQLRLHRMAKFVCDVQVLRRFAEFSFSSSSNSSLTETGTSQICSTFLVPGHVIHVLPNTTMPCDAILLHGTALLNESMLTGESVPVTKTSMPVVPRAGPRKYFDSRFDARHILFGGTEVIAARGAPQSGVLSTSSSPPPALALVFRTGFSTTHGRMMRAVLHPSAGNRADFKIETYKFLGFLTILAFIGCGLSLYFTLSKGLQFEVVLIRALDTFPNTIPPALSAAMTVGCSIAVTKLRKFWRIFCIAPSRVNIAGQVNTIVFDKTGTLTEEGLELEGVAFVRHLERKEKNGEEGTAEENLPLHLKLGHLAASVEEVPLHVCGALATCHSVMKVGGRFSGDPIEIQMLQFTKWTLSDVPFDFAELTPTAASSFIKNLDCYLPCLAEVGAPNPNLDTGLQQQHQQQRAAILRIVKRFEFSPQLQRMSVLVWDRNRGQLSVVCKGSPEQLAKLCRPDSVPATATSRLHRYMERGLRVLAFGIKYLDLSQEDWKLAARSSRSCVAKLESLTRTHIETELSFLGLAAFSNPLKADTQSAIATLRRAGCRCVMATGDNPLTSISVARTTGIIDTAATATMLLVDVVSPLTLNAVTPPETAKSRPTSSFPEDNNNNLSGQLIWTPIVHKAQSIGFLDDDTESPLLPSSSSCVVDHDDDNEVFAEKPFSTPSLQHLTSTSIRLFLENKDPRSLSFVLTGAAFRYLQATHHQLYGQGQWSKSAMEAAQPQTVYCVADPVNPCLKPAIPIDTFRIAISSYPSPPSRVFRSDSFCSTTPLYTRSADPEEPFLDNDGELDKLAASSNNVTDKHTSQAHTRNTSAWTTSTRDPSGPTCATTGSFKKVKHLWWCLRRSVSPSVAADCWLNRFGTSSHFNHGPRLSDSSTQIVELSAFEYCLRFTRVYARMSPEDKAALVTELRSLPASPLVAMCGDGANDCAALRAADVGLSLSDKEASMAAPFTSAKSTVQSCVNLLRESRSALVNSFQGFKSITLSATIQLMTTVALYYYGSNLTDPQYVWIDLAVVLPLSMTMSWTHAAWHLTQELPLRQLTGLPVILSLVGQALIQLFYVIMSLFLLSYVPFYTRFQPDVETTRFGPNDLESYENTVTFLISNGQYLMTNLVLSILGKPWRQSILTNWTYTTIVLALLLANFIFILCPNALPSISRWLSIISMPLYFRWMLVGLFLANSATTYAFEKCVIVNGFARRAQIADLPAHQIDRVLPPLCNNPHPQTRMTTVVQFVTTAV